VDWTAITFGPNIMNSRNLLYTVRLTQLRWNCKRKNTEIEKGNL